MSADDMAGMSMAMAPTLGDGVGYVAGWAVMMSAMMLPSALPMIGLYAATQRSAADPGSGVARVALFTLTYLGVWAMTGVRIYFGCVTFSAVSVHAQAYGVAGAFLVA